MAQDGKAGRKWSPPSPWETIRERIADGGIPSSIEDLLTAREMEPVPSDLQDYFYARLSEHIRPGRPLKTREQVAERDEETVDLDLHVRLCQAAYKLQGLSGPRDRAIREVARANGIKSETLRDRLKKGLRDKPKALLQRVTLADANRLMRDMVDDERVRLDPEVGYVRLPERESELRVLYFARDERGRPVVEPRDPSTYGPRVDELGD